MKKLILVLIILFSLQLNVFSTNPVRDYITYNNVKYTGYYKNVFWEYYGYRFQKFADLLGEHHTGSTACQFFTLDLEISNDSLFITKIYNCNRTFNLDLEKEFPDICKNNKIYAFWYTETMELGKGRVVSRDFINTYENEIVLYIDKGRVISEYDIVNTRTFFLTTKGKLFACNMENFMGKTINNYDRNIIDLCHCENKDKSFKIKYKTFKQVESDRILISKTFKKTPYDSTKIKEKETFISIETRKKKIRETYLIFNSGYYYLIELKYDNTLANKTLKRNFLNSLIFARIK